MLLGCLKQRSEISIHALREEGDTRTCRKTPGRSDFYPRPPRGGRLCSFEVLYKAYLISIHALREEGDRTAPLMSAASW